MSKISSFISVLLVLFIVIFSESELLLAQQLKLEAVPNTTGFSSLSGIFSDNLSNLYPTELKGKINRYNPSLVGGGKNVFLNLTSKVPQIFGEAGVIAVAFHPNYATNGYFFVDYNFLDTVNDIMYERVSRFTRSPTNPDSALFDSELIILDSIRFDQRGHYGTMGFGPNGYLYKLTGDASSDNYPDPDRGYRAQLLSDIHGKILRINIDVPANGKNYSIPSDNPYVGNTQGYLEEIYAYGVRNPWRMSYDSISGKIWFGDVGEDQYEEINILEKGANYGWNIMQGRHCNYTFPPPVACDTAGRNLTGPIWEYHHSVGTCVIGGYVYRGGKFPLLYGKYIFADWSGKIWSLDYDGVNPAQANLICNDSTIGTVTSIGEDANKELYFGVFQSNRPLYRLIVPTLNLKCLIEGLYNSQTNKMVSDTVRVYLRNTSVPYIIIDSAKGILDSNGTGVFYFPSAQNLVKYYIVVRHRNTLETWSKNPESGRFFNNILSFNFTTAVTQAYGNNMTLVGSQWTLYSGDVNQDGIIDLDDLVSVYNDASNFVTGYTSTDFNGDGFVDLSDLSITNNNANRFIIIKNPK